MNASVLGDNRRKVRVPGLRTPLFFDRMVGKSQAGRGLILKDDDRWRTPWLERKGQCCQAYMDKQYELAADEITPWRLNAENAIRELAFMSKNPISTANHESEQRQTAARAGRHQQLVQTLSTIDADLESLDALLAHRGERAEDILMTHVYAYWEGALKQKGDNALPPVPAYRLKESRSKEMYVRRKEELQGKIRSALAREEEEV